MSDYFPNSIAINIAKEVNLHTRKYCDFAPHGSAWIKFWTKEGEDEFDKHTLLAEFQACSLTSSFKECLALYGSYNLSKKQVKALKKIHKITPIWMKGKLFMDALEASDAEYQSTEQIVRAVRVLGLVK